MAFIVLHREPGDYPDALKPYVSEHSAAAAIKDIVKWDAYRPTPLHTLSTLADQLNIASVLYKDESQRFGLTSFKAVGGAYAVAKVLSEGLAPGATSGDVLSGRYASRLSDRIIACATAGNHGLAVAWAAKACGCACVVYMHEGVPISRETAIRAAGAQVVRTPGDYDQSVARLDRDARQHGWQIIADTAYPGYETIPSLIMQGYCVLTHEILSELTVQPVTHVVLQAGVGSFAAAIAAHLWITFGEKRPKIILVEPTEADCFYQSLKNGYPSEASGSLDTIMTGLATRGVSTSAWEILSRCVDSVITIDDDASLKMLDLLRSAKCGGERLDAGPSGVAGLSAVRMLASDPLIRKTLAIDEKARLLAFGTEGGNGLH